MQECCNNQYLIYNENHYLACLNCGSEVTEATATEEELKETYTLAK